MFIQMFVILLNKWRDVKTWTSNIIEWILPFCCVLLRPISLLLQYRNTGKTGDIDGLITVYKIVFPFSEELE